MGLKELLNEGFNKYLDPKESDEQLHRVQREALLIFDAFKEVCDKYEIVYMMGGGSALGAVRHNGFIPWDDDIDINMPRNEFERFKSVNTEMGKDYVLHAPNYNGTAVERFAKIFLRKGFDDDYLSRGTSIDIFIIENLPKNPFIRSIKGLLATITMGIASISTFYKAKTENDKKILCSSFKGALAYYFRVSVGTIISFIPTPVFYDLVDKTNQYKKNTGFSCVPSGRKHYFGEQFSTSVYLPTRKGTFEGRIVPLENNVDAYLTNLYGKDYMEIPPENKRERHFR